MKRLFLFASIILFGQQLNAFDVSEGIRQEARTWADKTTQLNQEERVLMSNLLHWTIEITRIDLLLRKFMRGFVALNRSICENSLTRTEQSISLKDAAKTVATFLKISQNYRTTYDAWKRCSDFIENNQTENFSVLLEQLKRSARQSVLTFLKNSATTLDELVEKNREQFSQIGNGIVLGMRVFSGLLQETSSLEAGDQQLTKANTLGQAANFMWEQSFAGVQAALEAQKPQEIIAGITKTLFEVYQEEFLNSMKKNYPDQTFSVLFKEEEA